MRPIGKNRDRGTETFGEREGIYGETKKIKKMEGEGVKKNKIKIEGEASRPSGPAKCPPPPVHVCKIRFQYVTLYL